ncbi:hypothetical protein V2W45_716603 [Cenococcum geophilum]
MDSEESPRALIERIRRENTLEGTIGATRVVSFMRQSLKLVSEQLYNKSTHFLLELLQNADDNEYTCSTPTLCITHQPGSLCVDCNEVGFTARNVEAICTIGGSTKAGSDHYIGEKGIGFKSVFKVANAVWISSGGYSFKLDTREDGELGMIAPQWDTFPETTQGRDTSFYLRISDRYDESELVEEITSFDPMLLLFLRRLKRIELKVTRTDGTKWSECLRRDDFEADGQKLVILNREQSSVQYIVKKHVVTELPPEPKRPNSSKSDVVLGFPVADLTEKPILVAEKVYAFLPIRSYGFNFLLQADFLLTANREDIDLSSPWNNALRRETVNAFLEAIDHFNSGPMRYYWPHYVPTGPVSSFFDTTKTRILEELSMRPVLESYFGTMARPRSLTYVPPTFRDTSDQPLILDAQSTPRFLSFNYPLWELDTLFHLGVTRQSSMDFLKGLKTLGESCYSKPALWHSELAKALLPLMADRQCKTFARELNLIPLRTEEWTNIHQKDIYFPQNAKGAEIPSGVSVLTINQEAAQDPVRRKLFKELGVKECSTFDVCRIIAHTHASTLYPPTLTRTEFVTHVVYLYKSSWRISNTVSLWFITENGKECLGSTLYVEEPVKEGSPLAHIYELLKTKFSFVNRDYIDRLSSIDDNWRKWLTASFGLSTIPRLVQVLPSMPGVVDYQLSDEMQFLFTKGISSDLLWILREHWSYYSKWIEDDESRKDAAEAASKLRQALGSIIVRCRNGRFSPLSNTVLLFLDREVGSHPDICVLDIPDPKSSRWSFLEYFGVAVKVDIQYYVRCIELLRNSQLNRQLLVHIYERIQAFYSGNEELVDYLFREKRLLYLPTKYSRSPRTLPWLSFQEARDQLPNLEAEFPTCTVLFRCLLANEDAELGPLIAKVTFITMSTTLSKITEIFHSLSKVIKTMNPIRAHAAIRPLMSRPIFPIVYSGRKDGFDVLACSSDPRFFIGDRAHLASSFRGVVPLLAFTSEELSEMQDLLWILKVNSLQLSKIVHSETKPQGRVSVHYEYTRFLRARTPFLQSLVPTPHPNRENVCVQIENIEAAVASSIVETHVLGAPGKELHGRSGKGEVAFLIAAEKLQFFFIEGCITAATPHFELVDSLSSYCQIVDTAHRTLLSLTLTDPDLERIRLIYLRHGIHVNLPPAPENDPEEAKRTKRYAGSAMELHTAASPFTHRDNDCAGTGNIDDEERLDGFRLLNISDLGRAERHEARQKAGDNARKNRGLPFLDVIQSDENFQDDSADSDDEANSQDNARLRLRYMGELMADIFFKNHLTPVYDPETHWTSSLRRRAGYAPFSNGKNTSAFELSGDASAHFSSILESQGQLEAASWRVTKPTYHFEIGVTAGDRREPFSLRISDLERIRKYRVQQDSPDNISILMRISDVYSNPTVDLYTNPWRLVASDRLIFSGNRRLMVKIENMSTSITVPPSFVVVPPGSPHVAPVPELDDLPLTQLCLKPQYLHFGSMKTPFFCHPTPSSNIPQHFSNPASWVTPAYPFCYQKLPEKEIRLLSLLPSESSERPLRGIIVHLPIESAGNFRALSYVWGADSRSSMLETAGGYLNITSSLHTALKHLRRKKKPLFLWVDAVCINQDDNQEKEIQIRLLPLIFRQVMSTLVFLGGDAVYDRAMQALMQISAKANQPSSKKEDKRSLQSRDQVAVNGSAVSEGKVNHQEDDGDAWPDCLPPIPSSWEDRPVPTPDNPLWHDIINLFQNPWFRRVWVIQEVVLASSIRMICGKWLVEWNDLYSAVETIDNEFCTSSAYSSLSTPWNNFLELAKHREWEARKTRWALIGLLETFRYAESTLARDRLFGLLGFAADGQNPAFEPDYKSSLETIICRFAHAFIEQGKIMLLLYRAGLSAASKEHAALFPSWIPDWTVPKPPCLFESSHRGIVFAASWRPQPHVKRCESPTEIAINGFRVDTVEAVSAATNTPEELSAYLNEVDEMVDGLNPNSHLDKDKHSYKGKKEELKWKVPVAGARYPRTTPDIDTDLHTSYKALRQVLHAEHTMISTTSLPPTSFTTTKSGNRYKPSPLRSSTTPPTLDLTAPSYSQNYKRALFECLTGWRFFVTLRGYVGIAPGVVQKGDLVSIFDGSAVPFLVRLHGSTDGLRVHRLVGECYVHGLMNGESKELTHIHEGWINLC